LYEVFGSPESKRLLALHDSHVGYHMPEAREDCLSVVRLFSV